ncbi:MAG: Gx transporter family protein [Lachnospiraceae bacterium]|nr:Gx transporter family protein [Lachnospiraceae bacterium]
MQSLTEKHRPKSSNDKEQIRIGRTAFLGLLLAFALILSYIETLIPFQSGVPGIKLGLANLAVILSLYLFGWKEALLLTTLKALLSGLLFGNLFMILYSLAGAWLSCISMVFMKKSGWFHLPVISGFGGVMHNAGQLIVAAVVVKTYGVLYYAPILIIAGLGVGLVIGAAASFVLPYIRNIMWKGTSYR